MLGLVSTGSLDTDLLLRKSCIPPPCDTSAVPPVNCMPMEILGEIFAFCLQNDIVQFPKPSHFPIAPLTLSHVCGYWRDTTLAFPILWSAIEVFYPRRCHLPMVELWLDRSGTCPLSLALFHDPEFNYEQHALTDEILALFIRHISRWREIDFSLCEKVQHPLLSIPEGAAGSLESASLDLESCGRDSAEKIWRAIHASPSLRRVNWWCSYGSVGMPTQIPWLRLTHITLHPTLTDDALLDILQQCRDVQVLQAHSVTASSTPSLQVPVLVPDLHTMMISVRSHSGILLDQLTLPSIRSLDIRHRGPFVPRDPQSLHNLLVRSSCDLERLKLDDIYIAEEDLLLYMKSPKLAFLIDLELTARITDTTITSFTHGNERYLFPNLESISLRTCRSSDGVVSAMVSSRLTSLRAVKLRMGGTSFAHDFASLEKMRESGLIVNAYNYNSTPT